MFSSKKKYIYIYKRTPKHGPIPLCLLLLKNKKNTERNTDENIVTVSVDEVYRDQLDNKTEDKSKSGRKGEKKKKTDTTVENRQFDRGALKLDNLAVQQWKKGDD